MLKSLVEYTCPQFCEMIITIIKIKYITIPVIFFHNYYGKNTIANLLSGRLTSTFDRCP